MACYGEEIKVRKRQSKGRIGERKDDGTDKYNEYQEGDEGVKEIL
jgi:hypothetical protein